MKTTIYYLSFFAVLLITACDKPTSSNSDTPDSTGIITHDTSTLKV